MGGALTLALCSSLWVYFKPASPPVAEQITSLPDAGYMVSGSGCAPASLAAIADRTVRQTTAEGCAEARDNFRRQQSDLEQQTRSANAASLGNRLGESQARIALVSAILSLLATSLLVWTLWETRAANRAQLRAYVIQEGFNLTHYSHLRGAQRRSSPGRAWIVIGIKNVGQTPAVSVRHHGKIALLPRDEHQPFDLPKNLEAVSQSVGAPGVPASKTLQIILSPEDEQSIARGEKTIYVWGRITYLDIFQRTRRTDYRVRYDGIWPPPAHAVLSFCDGGNLAD